MQFDVILTDANTIPEAFEEGYSMIRLDRVSQDEIEILNKIVSRNKEVLFIALPHSQEA